MNDASRVEPSAITSSATGASSVGKPMALKPWRVRFQTPAAGCCSPTGSDCSSAIVDHWPPIPIPVTSQSPDSCPSTNCPCTTISMSRKAYEVRIAPVVGSKSTFGKATVCIGLRMVPVRVPFSSRQSCSSSAPSSSDNPAPSSPVRVPSQMPVGSSSPASASQDSRSITGAVSGAWSEVSVVNIRTSRSG